MLKWGCISQGCYPRSWQGHSKVKPRSNVLKQLKISSFCWFFYNYVHLGTNTDLYQNTSRDYKIIIKGLEGLYPIDTKTWWHGLGSDFIEESAEGHGEVWREHDCSKSNKNKLLLPVFIDNLTLLWPWDDLTIYSEFNCTTIKQHKQDIYSCFELIWPCRDL